MIDAVYMVDADNCEDRFAALKPMTLSTDQDVERMSGHTGLALWIACHAATSAWLSRAMAARTRPRRDWLLFLEAPTPTALTVLRTLFDRVVAPPAAFLPTEELAEALASDERADLCIGGIIDPASEVVTLYRGDLRSITVPLSLFGPTPDGRRTAWPQTPPRSASPTMAARCASATTRPRSTLCCTRGTRTTGVASRSNTSRKTRASVPRSGACAYCGVCVSPTSPGSPPRQWPASSGAASSPRTPGRSPSSRIAWASNPINSPSSDPP